MTSANLRDPDRDAYLCRRETAYWMRESLLKGMSHSATLNLVPGADRYQAERTGYTFMSVMLKRICRVRDLTRCDSQPRWIGFLEGLSNGERPHLHILLQAPDGIDTFTLKKYAADAHRKMAAKAPCYIADPPGHIWFAPVTAEYAHYVSKELFTRDRAITDMIGNWLRH